MKVTKSKEELEQLNVLISDRDITIANQRIQLDKVLAQLGKTERDKSQADAELVALRVYENRVVTCLLDHVVSK